MGLFDFFKKKAQVKESMADAAIGLHNSAVGCSSIADVRPPWQL